MMKELKENIVEIFSSIQGEGLYIGYRQIFIRFSGCNLFCKYCDTIHKADKTCQIEYESASQNFSEASNPVCVDKLVNFIRKFDLDNHHSISLTGGEPLLYNDFILNFVRKLKKYSNIKILLETNGTLYKQLDTVIDCIDIISMDIKIPSTYGDKPLWEEHAEFVNIAKKYNKQVYTKIVVSSLTTQEEVSKLFDLKAFHTVPLVIQPISTQNQQERISNKRLLEIQSELSKYFDAVRVIPQTHKFLNIL